MPAENSVPSLPFRQEQDAERLAEDGNVWLAHGAYSSDGGDSDAAHRRVADTIYATALECGLPIEWVLCIAVTAVYMHTSVPQTRCVCVSISEHV